MLTSDAGIYAEYIYNCSPGLLTHIEHIKTVSAGAAIPPPAAAAASLRRLIAMPALLAAATSTESARGRR